MAKKEDQTVIHKLKCGDVLFKEGTKGDSFFIVKKGKIEISIQSKNEKVVLAHAETGDCIGEFAFISKQPRTATATVSQDAEVMEVSAEMYKELLDEVPFWAQAMIQELVKKLSNSTNLIRESQAKNTELLSALDVIME
jgi:CRP-like cAMP-binding protein